MKQKLIVGAVALSTSLSAWAESPDSTIPQDYVQTGRYSHVANEPVQAQKNPLKVVVNTRLPTTVQTVEQAVTFLLDRSGYHLADYSVLTPQARTLMSHDLPAVHRQIGPMTLDKALETLAGEAFQLVVDPVNRKVAFIADPSLFGGA